MSFALISVTDSLVVKEYSSSDWRKVLHLALRYGWKPLGTTGSQVKASLKVGDGPFDEDTWLFNLDSDTGIPSNHPLAYSPDVMLYCEDPVIRSYYQFLNQVSPEDAMALANALERALPHIPDGPTGYQVHMPGALFNPADWFAKSHRVLLDEMIAFCKRGGFEIAPYAKYKD